MGGVGNFQNFIKLGGANKLKWAEKNQKIGNWPPLQLERGEYIHYNKCTMTLIFQMKLKVKFTSTSYNSNQVIHILYQMYNYPDFEKTLSIVFPSTMQGI